MGRARPDLPGRHHRGRRDRPRGLARRSEQREQAAVIYDRSKLLQGDVIAGPAIITEMDSTTLVEHDCTATIDAVGNILINPKQEG